MLLKIIFLALLSIPIINIIFFFVQDVTKDLENGTKKTSEKNHMSKQYLKVAK